MSSSDKALAQLCAPAAVLATRGGAFGVFAGGDRRRRPRAKISAADVRALEAAGAIAPTPEGGFVITEAGRARVRRSSADAEDSYRVQHGAVVARPVIDADGGVRSVRGYEASGVLRKLGALCDARGKPWLTGAELAAAACLRADWETAQAGLVRGSDWTAPPNASSGRGKSSAQEAALAARCDARRRTADALAKLAPPLRRVVERACLNGEGLEELVRAEGWPGRSGKLALKLGLAQLAAAL